MLALFLLVAAVSALRSSRKETCFYQQFQGVRDNVNLLMSGVGMRSIETRLQSPDVLYSLFLAANGDAWSSKVGWGANTLICAWTGITCDDYGQVIEIALPSNNLQGDISTVQLHRLKYLKKVDLSGNNLNGMIPDSVAKATTLEELVLKNNGLLGAIPEKLGNLTALKVLDLSNNQLSSGIATLQGLTALTDLNLKNNMITGGIGFVTSLTKLEKLDVSDNLLSGNVPREIGDIADLSSVDLSANRFSGSLHANIGSLGKLAHLDLRSSGLSGIVPSEVGKLRAVTYLDLSASFIGQLPNELGDLNNLETLKIESPVSGTIPSSLKKCTKIKHLEIKSSITGPLPSQFSTLRNLESITINGGSSGALPATWGDLSKLTHLDLAKNSLVGGVPSTWNKLSTLNYLDLSRNALKDQVTALQNLTELETLYLNDNNLFGDIPQWMYHSTMPNLKLDGNLFECFIDDYCSNKQGTCDFEGNGTVSCSRQHVNNPELWTVCEGGAIMSGGQFVCSKPAVVYGRDGGKRGVPCSTGQADEALDLDHWCTELGMQDQPGFTYNGVRDCRAPRGKVMWCGNGTGSDQFCDMVNPEWKKTPLSTHDGCTACYSEIRCGMQVKMTKAGAGSALAGIVQVNRDNEWGTICGPFTAKEALVACRSLGFKDLQLGDARIFKAPQVSELSTTRILLKNLECDGTESNLASCKHDDWYQTTNCTHLDDLAVMCYRPRCKSAFNPHGSNNGFNDMLDNFPRCYLTDNKKSNMIWDEQSTSHIYIPSYARAGVVIANDSEASFANTVYSKSSFYQALVWMPNTRRAVYRNTANVYTNYAASKLRIGKVSDIDISVNQITWAGMNSPDYCYLLSSSDTHFLCMKSHSPQTIQFWESSVNSSTLTYDHEVILKNGNNPKSAATVVPSEGGTFAYDGEYFLIQNDGDSTSYRRLYVYHAKQTAANYGKELTSYSFNTYANKMFSGVYFEWAACRYTIHSNSGMRGGDNHVLQNRGSSGDEQCYTGPFLDYTCGNSICEPGEDTENCPSDCTCGRASLERLQDVTETGVFYSFDVCYQLPSHTRGSVIWDAYHDVLLVGDYAATQLCTFHGHQDFNCVWSTQTGYYYNQMAWSPATRILNWRSGPYNHIYAYRSSGGWRVGTIRGGAVVQYTYTRFDTEAPSYCYLASAGPDQTLCLYDTSGNINFYNNYRDSYTMKYSHKIRLRSYTSVMGTNPYGGTFAWDGEHMIFAYDPDNQANRNFRIYDKTGVYIGQYTTRTNGFLQNMYFEWSQCRYMLGNSRVYWSKPDQLDAARKMYRDDGAGTRARTSYSSITDEVCYSDIYPPTL